ncbi:hypothetical protein ACFX2F_019480 [Malus domestica]
MCRTLDACNSYVGTCAYMSSERFNPDTYDSNYDGYTSDIWSLGLTLIELYMGHFPFLTSRLETRLGHPHVRQRNRSSRGVDHTRLGTMDPDMVTMGGL